MVGVREGAGSNWGNVIVPILIGRDPAPRAALPPAPGAAVTSAAHYMTDIGQGASSGDIDDGIGTNSHRISSEINRLRRECCLRQLDMAEGKIENQLALRRRDWTVDGQGPQEREVSLASESPWGF